MTEITDEMLDVIEKVKGKRNPALWDPRCEQYMRNNKKVSFSGIVTGTSLSSTVGDLSTVSVSFITSGAITNAA
jgi:hypothetical protein